MLLERGALLSNRYRIIEILGQGGMGSVYKAVDENLGVEVAVKDNLFTTDDYARQFRREAVLLATLRHPNLPRVTDHFVIEGKGQYLVMDYIEGEDLRQRMDRLGMLPETEVVIIGAAICDALSYLSSCNPPIVHRDIKPGNVRITPEGTIFLVDFGLAKDLKSHQTTTTGARAMTPGYSPPEQYGTARTDQRTDIYSLGATLYAALTGMIPEDALSRAVDRVELTPVRKYNPTVSRRMAVVIEKALDIRPDDRYQTADEFKQALLSVSTPSQRLVNEYVVSPPPSFDTSALGEEGAIAAGAALRVQRLAVQPPSMPREGSRPRPNLNNDHSQPTTSRWKFFFVLLLVSILTMAAVAIYTINPSISKKALEQVFNNFGVVPPFPINTPTSASPQFTGDPTLVAGGGAISSPTGTLIPSKTPTIALTATPTVTSTPSLTPTMTPTSTITPTPTFTPTPLPTMIGNGNGQIAFASNRDSRLPQIWLISIESGELRKLTDIPEGACQPTFSPDGKQLIFVSGCERNKEIYRGSALFLIPDVDAENIEIIPLPTLPGGDYDPAWSPDGKKIAFTSLRETGSPRIFLMDIATKMILTPEPELFVRRYQPSWAPDSESLVLVEEAGLGRIVIASPDGSFEDLLRRSNDASDTHPAWSPDGKSIIFTRYPTQGKPPYLVGVSLGPSGDNPSNGLARPVQFPLVSGSVPMREAKFSPDGLWLVFETWPNGPDHDIAIMTTNGSSRRSVTNDPADDFDPAWRPSIR